MLVGTQSHGPTYLQVRLGDVVHLCALPLSTSVTQMSPMQKEREPLLGVHVPRITSCARSFVSIDISFVNSVW